MRIVRLILITLISFNTLFATSDRDNPKKAKYEHEQEVNQQRIHDYNEHDELDNPKIADPVRSADYISTSDKLRNGTISIENLFSDLIPNSRTTPDFSEYTVCAEGCDFNDLATAIDSVPDQSTIFITEPGEYTVIGSEITDRSIWIKGLSPEETIITGQINLEDLSDSLVYFEKEDYADWTLEQNQDRIKDDIWITRGDNMPIFNAAREGYDNWSDTDDIPTGTLWAQGRTADVDSSDYQTFIPMTDSDPLSIVNQVLSLKLPAAGPDSADVFFDIVFTKWTSNGNGGGFAYYRGEPGAYLPTDAPIEEDYFDIVFTKWTSDGNGGGFAYYRGEPGIELPSLNAMFNIAAVNEPVYVRFSDLTITNGKVSAIQVNSLWLDTNSPSENTTTIEIDNVIAHNNVNEEEDGGFLNNYYNRDEGVFTPSLLFLNVNNSVFSNNISGDDGGVFALRNVHATLTNSLFEGNFSDDDGAVFQGGPRSYSTEEFSLVVSGCEFTNNQANSIGGAINLNQTVSTASEDGGLFITNSTFSGNSSSYSGGAIAFTYWNGAFVVNATDFNNNTASSYGGAIYVYHQTDAYFNNVSADNNSSYQGGVIYLRNQWDIGDNNLDFHHCSFTNNSSSDAGGVIHENTYESYTNLNIYSSDFINNTSGENTGGLARLGKGTTYIEGSTFAGNVNTAGGTSVLYLHDDQTTYIVNSTFVNNETSNLGESSSVINNWAGYESSFLDLNNCTVAFNSASSAVNANYRTLYLSSTIVAGNTGVDISTYMPENITSHGNNLIGNLSSSVYHGNSNFVIDHINGMDWVGGYNDSTTVIYGDTNLVNTYSDAINPLLVLVDDGETPPHAMPYPGSIAVNNGSSTYTLGEDESYLELDHDVRGMPRTWTTETDIGSVERHASDLFGEQIPPAMIDDLSAEPSPDGGLLLTWTAVGEDGVNGTADHYIIYYGTAHFSSESESDYSMVLPIEPSYAGNLESFHLTELDYGTEYYLAVVALDMVGQSSPLADPVSMATMQPPVAEITVNELSITLPENGEGTRYGTITNSGEANLKFSIDFSEDEDQTRTANDKVLFVTGASYPSQSVFYWLDVATGEIESLGQLYDGDGIAIGGDDAGYGGITGIAQNPIDGLWYGVETEGRLFSFTPGDSNATVIGFHNASYHIPDIDFGPDGTLYGWSEGCDCLIKINLETAEVDEFGPEISSWGTGLAVDPNGQFAYMKAEYDFYTLNLATGAEINYMELPGDQNEYLVNMLDIGSDGDFYTGLRTNWDEGGFVFCSIDTAVGTVTQLYSFDIEYVSAISVESSSWVTPDPSGGILSSGESVQIAMNYSATGLEDSTYTGQLLFETNDPSAENTVFNLTLTVSDDNLPPVLLTEALPNAVEDEAYSFQLEGFDTNGDAISYSLTSGPDWLGISETGELDGTPANEDVGDSLMITVSISDSISAAAESVFYISVENTNDAPVVTEAIADVEVDEDAEPLTIDLSQVFGDEDAGDLIGYSVQGYLTFRKIDFADWTMEENQDRVADNVWLTRQNNMSIFNIALEESSSDESPLGTEWAYGHTEHIEGLTFQNFKTTVNNAPPSSLGRPLVLHTIDEDAYYDMMIHQWSGGGPGGGFAWTRSSNGNPVVTPELNGSNLVFHFHPDAYGETEIVIVATDQSGAIALDTVGITVNSVNDSPGDFTLLIPENNSVVSDLTPTFTWEAPLDPDNSESMGGDVINGAMAKASPVAQNQNMTRSISTYNVYIGGSPEFTTYDVVAVVTDNYYTHEVELSEDQVYYWMIEAVDNGGSVTVSETWSFTVNSQNAPPSSFALISPGSGVVLNTQEVNFEWEASSDMDPMDEVHYSIDIHSDTTHMHFQTDSTSILSENLMDNSVYHWGVHASDMNGGMTENIGGPQMFVINVANDAPTAASLVAPLDGSIQTVLTPNFYWTESLDPDPLDHVSYTMSWWAVEGTGSESVNTDSNGVTPETNLMDNSMYGWIVNTMDMNNAEAHSDTSHFYTDVFPEPPLNFITLSPENNATGVGTEVQFVWNATTDPDPIETIHYQLIYTDNWDDSASYVFSELLEDTTLTVMLEDNSQYYWGVVAMDSDGFMIGSNNNTPNTLVIGTLSIDEDLIPEVFALHQNFPNPFNPVTTIRYDVPFESNVHIQIFDILGRKVSTLVNEYQTPGFKSIVWNGLDQTGSPVGAGVYFYIIDAGSFHQTKKMILLK